MQPTDHRGRPVGNPATSHGGHRPTPRVVQALQSYFKINEPTAQSVIDAHRSGEQYMDEDYYGIDYPHEAYAAGAAYDPNVHGHPDTDSVGNRIGSVQNAISTAISSRSGKNKQGYSSPYDYPPTVKY